MRGDGRFYMMALHTSRITEEQALSVNRKAKKK